MKHLFLTLLAILCAATGYGQTMKALGYNTTNGNVVYAGTNNLNFTNYVYFDSDTSIGGSAGELRYGGQVRIELETGLIGMPLFWANPTNAANTRINLGLGETNTVTFAGLTNNGDITINQTATNNGLLYIRRTNNEPFLGLANLIASNNTTISNETLFRVGTAEATNRSAQFGFRSTNTNGSGVAVFSVFGYNALMQIGADASTNAVIYSGGGTNNQVMTLIKSGATEFARPISFANATDAATTRTNVGLPLAALTNTSNVTTMRALAGSTNTNAPFSGAVELSDGVISWLLTFSNGILLNLAEQ
jgi:hypothetical protein